MNSLTLPPISTLLKETPRIIVQPDSPNTLPISHHSPCYLSPLLSPISYASSLTRSPSPVSPILPLPPIHGDDPPRPLSYHPTPTRPQNMWNSRHSYTQETQELKEPLEESQEEPQEEKIPDLPFTQIILSESGQAILKRRRGRPPNMKPYMDGSNEKHWTFLTPTVWDVNHEAHSQTTEPKEDLMHGSMAAFTSSSMDMVLQMPRKKRGRKPKSHIEGHSCFVWKDIPASKKAKK
ncbi:unnamed protein product [Rhizopus stolonifer]